MELLWLASCVMDRAREGSEKMNKSFSALRPTERPSPGSGGRDITDDGDYCKVICQANGGCSVEVSAAKNSVQLTNFDCIVE